jgi:streptomycin 3"-adenylyltransferase
LVIPVEALQALKIVKGCFGNSLIAVYLHGSAVAGGLRPNSDVDLLVIVGRPTTRADHKRLVAELLKISGRYPADDAGRRPLELIVFHRADLTASAYPARSEFVYGEWLREAFEVGEMSEPVSDPEFTLLLAQARQKARTLIGPDPAELLPIIPESDIRRAIGDALPSLLGTLEGDERNVLLTLVRMWRTLSTGDFVPKDVAAKWAMPRLDAEAAALVAHAREAYLGKAKDDWQVRQRKARQVADHLGKRVAAML